MQSDNTRENGGLQTRHTEKHTDTNVESRSPTRGMPGSKIVLLRGLVSPLRSFFFSSGSLVLVVASRVHETLIWFLPSVLVVVVVVVGLAVAAVLLPLSQNF